MFENNSACEHFLKVLNVQHKNIQFTMEKSTDVRNITILDAQIELNETGYNTCVWRKLTNTGLLLHFNAVFPRTWKSGLIISCLHRAKKICSTNFLYKKEVVKVQSLFRKNGDPKSFINNVISKFNDGKFKAEKYERLFLQLAYHIREELPTNLQNAWQI